MTDAELVELHRDIKETMKKHGFEYSTGKYFGLDDARMNFVSKDEIIVVRVDVKQKEDFGNDESGI